MKKRQSVQQVIIALIIFLCSIAASPAFLQAQNIPPAIMAQVNAELQKRGLTESEVRVRLLQKGIDIDNIPPAELPQYQERITAVLDELQSEKGNAKNPQPQIIINTQQATPTTASNQTTGANVQPQTTPQEAAAEAALRISKENNASDQGKSPIYGHSLFSDQSLDVFRTTDGAQAPETYVLGDGDDIRITIFGASQTDIQQKIAADGSIQPTGVAKIFLKGLTLAQAREVIRERLSSAYTFRADQLAVTIATARTILVNVFGEAKVTGGFTISALNSAINVLSVAGGPTEIGSVRDIRIIRGNTRKSLDLYAFMNDPATQFKFDLQNNDIIFVPVIKLLVSVEGAVNRPMSYEMLPGETLNDLINYAGGLKMNVYPEFVQIKRFVNGEERLLEWNLSEITSGKNKIPLMNGDVVKIKTIGKPMDQYVDVEGSVYYPGRFDFSSNQSLKRLLENAKPTYQAKTDILFIERTKADETIELLTVPFPGTQPGANDFELQPRDKVRIMDLAAYRDIANISVNGQVRIPFSKSLGLNERLTVNQAIEMAGGLKTSVYPVAYIFRKNLFNPAEMKYIRIELNQAGSTELQPGDQLNIYDNSSFTNIGEVRVTGAVKNPRSFTWDPTLTVRDVLTNAEGFTVGAAFNRVEIFRTILSPTEKTRLDMITLEVDSSYQVVNPKNFALQPYDQVVVRLTPDFTLGRTIELNGQVRYPGVYVLESKQTKLSDIIIQAGGLLSDADPYGTQLFRTYRNRGFISTPVGKNTGLPGSIKSDPILFEGDVININRLENIVTILESGTRMNQFSMNNDTTGLKNVIYQGQHSAAWYIRNFAGGFQQRANRKSVTVTLPNDQMIATKKSFFIFRNYPDAQPGSVISLQMKPPKEKPADGKKTDWDNIFGRTTSAVTSVLTLYLLVQQLAK
jgi:protein involved in polysaccharide export with SLBB domain